MTVKELIEALKKFPEDSPVWIVGSGVGELDMVVEGMDKKRVMLYQLPQKPAKR